MAKISPARVAGGVGSGLIAAAAAGYYFYGSKRAKKHRDVITKEMKTDWKLIQKELKKIDTKPLKDHATKVGKKVVAKGQKMSQKIANKVTKKATSVAKKYS